MMIYTFIRFCLIYFVSILLSFSSECCGKVRVLFFRATTLISRGKSHVSRVRGLVVRCLLFNPEVSCSNPWVCANFYKYSEAEGSHFRHYGTFRLCGFFSKFFKCRQRTNAYFATERMLKKIPKGPFPNFRHYETVQNSHFFSKNF